MSNDTDRKNDEKLLGLVGHFIRSHVTPEEEAWAADELIKSFAKEKNLGALLKFCETGKLTDELRVKAQLAIVECVPLHEERVPGREPKKYGILSDLAFDRKRPDEVRIAAGKKQVDRIIEKIRRGDASAKTDIEKVLRHRRYHKEVKTYAKNSLDALEAGKDKGKGAFAKTKGKRPPVGPQYKPVPAAQTRFGGGFVP